MRGASTLRNSESVSMIRERPGHLYTAFKTVQGGIACQKQALRQVGAPEAVCAAAVSGAPHGLKSQSTVCPLGGRRAALQQFVTLLEIPLQEESEIQA